MVCPPRSSQERAPASPRARPALPLLSPAGLPGLAGKNPGPPRRRSPQDSGRPAPPRPPRPPLLLTLLVPPTGQAPSCFRALAWAAASSRDTPLQMPPWPWPSRQSRLGSSSLPQRRPPNRPSRSCALPAALLSAPRSALPVRWQRVGNDPSVYSPLLCLAPASSSSRKVGNGVPSVLCWVSSASNRAGHTVVAEVC